MNNNKKYAHVVNYRKQIEENCAPLLLQEDIQISNYISLNQYKHLFNVPERLPML
jgi:hypothetical protein